MEEVIPPPPTHTWLFSVFAFIEQEFFVIGVIVTGSKLTLKSRFYISLKLRLAYIVILCPMEYSEYSNPLQAECYSKLFCHLNIFSTTDVHCADKYLMPSVSVCSDPPL